VARLTPCPSSESFSAACKARHILKRLRPD
jgi:hypothetical protein